jgi:uncharacterized protein (UPF0335 family)
MSSLIPELYTKLKNEHDILERICKIEEEKNKLLVSGKLSNFSEVNEVLECLITKSERLEEERAKLTDDVLNSLGINKTLSFLELIETLPSEEKGRFRSMYESFKDVLTKIKLLSASNSQMLKDTVRILDITLSHLTADDSVDYNPGFVEKKGGRSLLLNKLA